MLLMNAYDASPEAMIVPHLRCVACGRHDGALNVAWFAEYEPSPRQTIPLAVHKGECHHRLEVAGGDAHDSWFDADEVTNQLKNNTEDPPVTGVEVEGSTLLRINELSVDLLWTQEILDRLQSPIVKHRLGPVGGSR